MADQRLAAAQRHVGRELLAQRRLADAGLADHHDQAALARERGVEGRLQLRQLRLAADEGAAVERVVAARRLRARPSACAAASTVATASSASRTSVGRRRALRRVLLQQAQDQRLEAGRAVRAVPGGRDRRRVEVLADDRDGLVADEGRPAADHLVEHRAERVEVASAA